MEAADVLHVLLHRQVVVEHGLVGHERQRGARTDGPGGYAVDAHLAADHGRTTVVVASAAGPYRVTLRGPVRVDDGKWHQMAIIIDRGWFSVVDVSLVVDGTVVASGQMRPGLFGAAPQLGMDSIVQIGARDGVARMRGDLLVVAVRPTVVPAATLSRRWQKGNMVRRAATGWGIILG